MTWEATPSARAPPPPPPLVEIPELGGTLEMEEASEPGGMDDNVVSAPTTPMPVLGRGIPHQLRTVSPRCKLAMVTDQKVWSQAV